MKYNHCCRDMDRAINSYESSLVFVPKFREYGIQIVDGGTSFLEIHYCPWCGSKLPESLRDEWFNRLDELNIDPAIDNVPDIFLSERWYSEGRKADSER